MRDTSDTPSKKQKTGKVVGKATGSTVLKAGTSSHPSTISSKMTGNEKKQDVEERKKTRQTVKDETRQERILKSLHSNPILAIAHFLSHSIIAFDKKSVIPDEKSSDTQAERNTRKSTA